MRKNRIVLKRADSGVTKSFRTADVESIKVSSSGNLDIRLDGGTIIQETSVIDPVTENAYAEKMAERIAEIVAASKGHRRYLPKTFTIEYIAY